MRGGALLLLAARLVSAATTLIVLAVAGRVNPDQLGAIGIGAAAGAIAAALVDAGAGALLIRETSRHPDELGSMLGFGLCVEAITGPVIVAATGAILAMLFGGAWPVMLGMAAALVVQQVAELTRSCFIASRRFGVSAAHSVVENTVWLAVVLGLLVTGVQLAAALLAGVGVMALSVVAGVGLVRSMLRTWPKVPDLAATWRLGAALRPFVAFNVLGIAYGRLDTILVGALLPTAALVEAGVYFTASRVMATAEFVPDVVARSLFPDIAEVYASDPHRVSPIVRPVVGLLLAYALPIPVLFAIAGDSILRLLIGPVAVGYGWLATCLALAVPIRSISYVLGMSLTSADAQGRRVLAAGSALLLVSVIDVVFLPRVGVVAAAAGSVAGAGMVAAVYLRAFASRFGPPASGRELARALVATACAGVVGEAASAVVGPWVGVAAFIGGYVLATALVNPGVIATLRSPAPSRPTGA